MTAIALWAFILAFVSLLFAPTFKPKLWLYKIILAACLWTAAIALTFIAYGVTVWVWNAMP